MQRLLHVEQVLGDELLQPEEPTGGDDKAPILFAASAQPLALTLIKWLYIRLTHVHDLSENDATALLSKRMHVLFKPHDDGPRACADELHEVNIARGADAGLVVMAAFVPSLLESELPEIP